MSSNIQYGNATHQKDLALSDISILISYPVVSLTSILSPFLSLTYHSLPEGKYSHAAVWPLTHGYDVLDKDGKKAYRRQIRIGRQNPQYYEVLEGLEKGERVIVSGYESYKDNEVLILK